MPNEEEMESLLTEMDVEDKMNPTEPQKQDAVQRFRDRMKEKMVEQSDKWHQVTIANNSERYPYYVQGYVDGVKHFRTRTTGRYFGDLDSSPADCYPMLSKEGFFLLSHMNDTFRTKHDVKIRLVQVHSKTLTDTEVQASYDSANDDLPLHAIERMIKQQRMRKKLFLPKALLKAGGKGPKRVKQLTREIFAFGEPSVLPSVWNHPLTYDLFGLTTTMGRKRFHDLIPYWQSYPSVASLFLELEQVQPL